MVDLIFGRWSSQVLWVLTHDGRLRFTELRHRLPAVSPKVLTQRLRQLERDGLIERTYYAEMPPRVEYEPTELGRSLSPVFQTMAAWADSHLDQVVAARRRHDQGGRQ
ncbi:helix-turn-helix transcriptional regulator [Kribbella sp. NBC_01245]|uniref:winged helix-turn-helix transcriptional regulator n=1 Tax=Kribbella sp. NBC_01245 TaxID=2903578 RepID=UPI002E2E3CB3|nr:helix-turn-helix domain-containing protein [Kribbella sp. NBC_01245]